MTSSEATVLVAHSIYGGPPDKWVASQARQFIQEGLAAEMVLDRLQHDSIRREARGMSSLPSRYSPTGTGIRQHIINDGVRKAHDERKGFQLHDYYPEQDLLRGCQKCGGDEPMDSIHQCWHTPCIGINRGP